MPPVPNFNFREQEIKEIHDAVESNDNKDKLWFVVHALAGTGKSEIARKYAAEYSSYYGRNCVWINSSSRKSLETAFIEIAERCELQIKDDDKKLKPMDYIINKVHEHLRIDRVLYVFDDVTNVMDIRDFLPDYVSSVSLITTQLTKWPKYEFRLRHLNMFNEDESNKYLVDCINEENKLIVGKATLAKIVTLLGGHPLALQQFVKAISNFSKDTVDQFINAFKSQTCKSLTLDMSLPPSNVTAIAAIKVNIERLKSSTDTELAISILNTVMYLDITEISMEVINMLFGDCDLLDITNAIQQLHSRSLLTNQNTAEGIQFLTVHSLIQKTVLLLHNETGCTSNYLEKCITTFLNAIKKNFWDDWFFHCNFGEYWVKHFLYNNDK